MLDPISSNQAIGTAARPWITTPTARLSRTWAPTLDYSSTWGNWNFNLGPNDWDFLSICLLLTPYQDWSAFPTPIVHDLRNSAKVYSTQPMESCHWSPFYPKLIRMHDCKTPTRFSQICRRSSAYIPQLRWIPYCTHIGGMHSLHHCTPYQ